MRLKNSEERFGLLTKLLHWLVAILIIGLIWLGWYMVGLTYYDRWYNDSLSTHKALGLLVLALGVAKLAWAMHSRAPAFVPTIKRWERIAATATHHTLYLMMLLIPLTGYLISTSKGDAVSFFGWFEIPAFFVVTERLRDVAIDVHFYASYGTAVIAAMHALAAVKHQFLDKDGTLRRMLW